MMMFARGIPVEADNSCLNCNGVIPVTQSVESTTVLVAVATEVTMPLQHSASVQTAAAHTVLALLGDSTTGHTKPLPPQVPRQLPVWNQVPSDRQISVPLPENPALQLYVQKLPVLVLEGQEGVLALAGGLGVPQSTTQLPVWAHDQSDRQVNVPLPEYPVMQLYVQELPAVVPEGQEGVFALVGVVGVPQSMRVEEAVFVRVDEEVGLCVFVALEVAVGVGLGLTVGVDEPVGVGVGLDVGLGVREELGVRVRVGVELGVGLGLEVGVSVGLNVTVGLDEETGLRVPVALEVAVGVGLGLPVGVGLGVLVGEELGVALGLEVGVSVGLIVAVCVGVDPGGGRRLIVGLEVSVGVGVELGVLVGEELGVEVGLEVG
eukprot:RCo002092